MCAVHYCTSCCFRGCTPPLLGSPLLQRLEGPCRTCLLLLWGTPSWQTATTSFCCPSRLCAGSLVPDSSTLLQQLAGSDQIHLLLQRGIRVVGGYMSPVNDAYTKPGLLPAAHRLQMCRAAASTHPRLMVDPWEAAQPEAQRSLLVLRRVEAALLQAQQQVAQQSAAAAAHVALPASDASQPGAALQGAAEGSLSPQGGSSGGVAAVSQPAPEAATALQATDGACAAVRRSSSSRPAASPIVKLRSPFSNIPAWESTGGAEQAQAAAGSDSSCPPALHSSPSSDTDRVERGDLPQRPALGSSEEQAGVLPNRPGLESSTRAPGVLRSGSFLHNLADLEARHSAQLSARQVSSFMRRLRQDALGDCNTVLVGAQWGVHQSGCRCLQSSLTECRCACWCAANSFPGELAWVQAWVQATATLMDRVIVPSVR